MTHSGVEIGSGIVDDYQEMKLKKRYQYIVYKVSDNLRIIETVEKGEPGASFDDFCKLMPLDDCRYGVFDWKVDLGGGEVRQKLVFYSWTPDDAKVKRKMVHASSKDTLKKTLNGIQMELQVTDVSELDPEEVFGRVRKGVN